MHIEFIPLEGNQPLATEILELADGDFKKYLGFNNSLFEGVSYITHPDQYTKYYAVYVNSILSGIVYYYDYSAEYHKCAIGFGLVPVSRGKGISYPVLQKFCTDLETRMGIVRIQADVETTNEHCLRSFGSKLDRLGFKYEYTAENYWGYHVTCNIYSRCVK